MSKEVTITKDNFESEVKNSGVPVLLDFWADWCMPCKMVAPVLEELSSEYDGKLKIGKVDVDQNQELASQYNVVSIPTLLLMKDGEVVKQQVGAVPRAQIEELIKDYV
ncbi:MAG: thioredoxin [Spirochaetales bacterium]